MSAQKMEANMFKSSMKRRQDMIVKKPKIKQVIAAEYLPKKW